MRLNGIASYLIPLFEHDLFGKPVSTFPDHALVGVDDQFFFREELERAIALHIDRVPKITVSGRENGNDDALFMIVGRLFHPLAYRKFGHRELLSESSGMIIAPIWLTHLKQNGAAAFESATLVP
jgi:hypothetical protein